MKIVDVMEGVWVRVIGLLGLGGVVRVGCVKMYRDEKLFPIRPSEMQLVP
jgi:hypothetical protein